MGVNYFSYERMFYEKTNKTAFINTLKNRRIITFFKYEKEKFHFTGKKGIL